MSRETNFDRALLVVREATDKLNLRMRIISALDDAEERGRTSDPGAGKRRGEGGMSGLRFKIERRGDVDVVAYDSGSCRPANSNEILLWDLIEKQAQALERIRVWHKCPGNQCSVCLEVLSARVSEFKQAYCPCGGIILADTEGWKIPLCDECYTAIGEPKNDPSQNT